MSSMHCMVIENIGSYLETLGGVIDLYADGDFSFPDAAGEWLSGAEEVMSKLRLPDGARLAALRGKILAAGDNTKDPDGYFSRSLSRKAREVAAAESLEIAEEVMRGSLQSSREQLEHFRSKLAEAITAAALSNVIPLPETTPRQVWLNQVWAAFAAFQATRPSAIYIAASLTITDRIYLLDQVMNHLLNNQMPTLNPAALDSLDTDVV